MAALKLKICGMREAGNIAAIAELSPDYMGFIFYKQSPRYVGEDFVLPADFPSAIIPVGVFVNEESEVIKKLASHAGIKVLQLHGKESVAQCQELKAAGFVIIKVFSLDKDFDFDTVHPYKQAVDYFLFDTKGKYYGGNAQVFDWELLKQYDQKIPFFLSGGLSPDNINEVELLRDMNLYALDLNSGVEVSAGVKNKESVGAVKTWMSTFNIN